MTKVISKEIYNNESKAETKTNTEFFYDQEFLVQTLEQKV